MSLACTTVSSQPMSIPKIPKRRLVAQILAFDDQKKDCVPMGKKYVFNPRHCSLRGLCIDRELLTTLLAGTAHAIDDGFCETLSLSFGEEQVCLDTASEHPLAPRKLTYGKTLDLLFHGLGSGLLGLRLRAIAG